MPGFVVLSGVSTWIVPCIFMSFAALACRFILDDRRFPREIVVLVGVGARGC